MVQIKLVRAFIASPSGLEEERRAAREAANEVNATIARPLGYRVELVGWEDTISGVGRPQAIINDELEQCEVFIGALWTRWGTKPSIDGPFSSGFQEEFELSLTRSRTTGSPSMSLFFKEISDEQLGDPGKELEKVLAFRQRIIDEKELLFQNFSSPAEFAQKVRACLSKYITTRHVTELASDNDKSEGTAAAKTDRSEGTSIIKRKEEAAVLKLFSERLETAESSGNLSPAEIARLRLVACAVHSSANDEGKLGVHDANLIYLHREEFSFSTREKWTLVGTGLADLSAQVERLGRTLSRPSSPSAGLRRRSVAFPRQDCQSLGLHLRMRPDALNHAEFEQFESAKESPQNLEFERRLSRQQRTLLAAASQGLRGAATAHHLGAIGPHLDRANP